MPHIWVIGRISIHISKAILILACAKAIWTMLIHVPVVSPVQKVQARLTGLHWNRPTKMKTSPIRVLTPRVTHNTRRIFSSGRWNIRRYVKRMDVLVISMQAWYNVCKA